jgi:hypothetical protein
VNPYLIAGAAAVFLATGFTAGWKVNSWRHDSQELAIQKAGEAATLAAVEAIKDIRIQRVTVRQELEREIRLQPVPAICDLSDGLFNAVNQAITGEGVSGAGVPGTDAAAGQDP